MPMLIEDYLQLGLDQTGPATCNGRSNQDVASSLGCPEDTQYRPCPEASRPVRVGAVTSIKHFESLTFPGTTRKLWLYSPPMRSPNAPNRLVLFNDGGAYLDASGSVAAAGVFDALHEMGELINTFGIFVQPGQTSVMPPATPLASYSVLEAQRSWEYDRLSPDYGRFLLDEILPLAAEHLQVEFSDQARDRLLCGISSGGIAAFTAAWHYPEQFGNVLSHCGSFTNIWGGHNYPYLIRTTPRKALRVILQSGRRDAATLFGDWATANHAMAKALGYAGYDYEFVFGEGGHTLRHGGSMFAENLRWFWPTPK